MMGHYRSEMYTTAELEAEELRAKKDRESLVKGINLAIENQGLENVLADILEMGIAMSRMGYRDRGRGE